MIGDCSPCISFSTANWNGEQVIIRIDDACGGFDIGGSDFYNCNGKELGQANVWIGGVIEKGISFNELENINTIYECSDCEKIENITIEEVGTNHLVLDWSPYFSIEDDTYTFEWRKGSSSSWSSVLLGPTFGEENYYSIGSENFTANSCEFPDCAIILPVPDNPAPKIIINGLEACTSYQFRVKKKCKSGEITSYSTTRTVSTGDCNNSYNRSCLSASLNNFQGGLSLGYVYKSYIETIFIGNFIDQIINCNDNDDCNGCGFLSFDGYLHRENDNITLVAGEETNLAFLIGPEKLTNQSESTEYNSGYIKIWIDLNEDLDFNDSNEMVYSSGRIDSRTLIFNVFTVPTIPISGNKRMRIVYRHDAPPEPCGTYCTGLTIDYDVKIEVVPSQPSCLSNDELLCQKWVQDTLDFYPLPPFDLSSCDDPNSIFGYGLGLFEYNENQILRITWGGFDTEFGRYYDCEGNFLGTFEFDSGVTFDPPYLQSFEVKETLWDCSQSLPCQEEVNDCVARDKTALIALYNATDGDNWKDNTNWKSDMPLGEWYGVTTNEDGCVIKLNLRNNNLNGQLIDLNLPNLENFNCNSNSLSGSIPNFSNLPNLRDFSCGVNSLSGSIPDFSNLPNLEELYCLDNSLSGSIPDFSNLSNLEFFACSYNSLSGSIPDFSNLSDLEFFACDNNSLSGSIPDFSNLPNLESFYCLQNSLSNRIPSLQNCPNLIGLYVNNNQLSGCFPERFNPFICDLGFNPSSPDLEHLVGYNFKNNPGLAWSGDIESWCSGDSQIDAPCDDGNPETKNDQITTDCECNGDEIIEPPWELSPCIGFVELQFIQIDRTNNRVEGTIGGEPLEAGDYIGVYYLNENGDTIVQDAKPFPATGTSDFLTICADNPATPEKDGFEIGERLQFMVFKNELEYPNIKADFYSIGSFEADDPSAEEKFIGGFRDSYLKLLNSFAKPDPPNCEDPFLISCDGQPIRSSNIKDEKSVVNNFCGSDNLVNGPEAYFLLKMEEKSDVKIEMTGLTEDLELYVLGASCNDNNCFAKSENYGLEDEIILIRNLDIGEYFIVVDGYIDAESEFFLEVNCLNLEEDELCLTPTPLILSCSETSTIINSTTNDVNLKNCVNAYNCRPNTFEGGKEKVFSFRVEEERYVRLSLRPTDKNLDLFLLDGTDPLRDCIRSSTEPLDRWDGFWFLPIPNKEYYVVVDGYNDNNGDFELEVFCTDPPTPCPNPPCPPPPPKPIDCTNAPEVFCNDTIMGTNSSGENCYLSWGSCTGKENSGKEVFFKFENPQTQQVIFHLRKMTQNLNLYILDECHPFTCLGQGGSKGIGRLDILDEAVVKPALPKGEYIIVVDGVRGAVSNFELIIECSDPPLCLDIELFPGPNLISTNLLPKDRTFSTIIQSIAQEVKFVHSDDVSNTIYSPGNNNPRIDKWEDIEAYMFILENDADPITFQICGQPVDATLSKAVEKKAANADIAQNYIGFPFEESLRVSEAFKDADLSKLDRIIYRSSNELQTHFFNNPNVNNYEMLPGRGYTLFVKEDHEFAYSREKNKKYICKDCERFKTPLNGIVELAYFGAEGSTFSEYMEAGDELGIFDTDDNILGSFKFDNNYASIVIQGNDLTTIFDEGFEEEENIKVKIYNQTTGKIREYLPVWKNGRKNEYKSGLIYDLQSLIPVDSPERSDFTAEVYPNPFTQTATLELQMPTTGNATLQILSINGQKIQTKNISYQAGLNQLNIDLSIEKEGLFFLKIFNNNNCKVLPIVKL